MSSPFPGMNPYLEQAVVWHDFHESLIPRIRDLLTAQVRPRYFVKIDEHVYIHEMGAETRRFLGRADVKLTEADRPAGAAEGIATLAAPLEVQIPAVDIERLSFVEICDREDGHVVTVIEVLSPANKYAGPDREQYLAKRGQLLNSAVHLIEIDLLRGGPRLPLLNLPACDYYTLVSRWETRPRAACWPIRLRDPLPVIPVPLQAPHADARLDLQPLVHQIYDAAGYEDYLYRNQPQPRLGDEDHAWAQSLLSATGA